MRSDDGGRDASCEDDEALDAFVARRPKRHPARIVSIVAVLLVTAAVIGPTWDELRYHFNRRAPLDLGDVSATGVSVLPLDTPVRARVVLGNRAARIEGWRRGTLRMGPIEVRQVLGAPLFVEYAEATHPSWGPFVQVELQGRVVAMEGADLEEVRVFIGREQGLEIPPDARVLIVDEVPGEMDRYVIAWIGGLAVALLALRAMRRRDA